MGSDVEAVVRFELGTRELGTGRDVVEKNCGQVKSIAASAVPVCLGVSETRGTGGRIGWGQVRCGKGAGGLGFELGTGRMWKRGGSNWGTGRMWKRRVRGSVHQVVGESRGTGQMKGSNWGMGRMWKRWGRFELGTRELGTGRDVVEKNCGQVKSIACEARSWLPRSE